MPPPIIMNAGLENYHGEIESVLIQPVHFRIRSCRQQNFLFGLESQQIGKWTRYDPNEQPVKNMATTNSSSTVVVEKSSL